MNGKKTDKQIPAFRFETLLWGGEELLFVMPAWLGLAFAQGFFDCVKDWKVPEGIQHAGKPLTFSAGLVFCHHKTPIRQAKQVAKLLAEAGKDVLGSDMSAQKNVINIEMFESIAMPDADVSGYRKKLYGMKDEDDDKILKSLLTLEVRPPEQDSSPDKGTFEDALKKITEMKEESPRSQVYKFIRAAKEHKVFDVGNGKQDFAKFVETVDLYSERAGANSNMNKDDLNFLLESPFVKARSLPQAQSLAYSCAFIAQFWDYVNPTGEPVPKPTKDSANSITAMGGGQ